MVIFMGLSPSATVRSARVSGCGPQGSNMGLQGVSPILNIGYLWVQQWSQSGKKSPEKYWKFSSHSSYKKVPKSKSRHMMLFDQIVHTHWMRSQNPLYSLATGCLTTYAFEICSTTPPQPLQPCVFSTRPLSNPGSKGKCDSNMQRLGFSGPLSVSFINHMTLASNIHFLIWFNWHSNWLIFALNNV